MVREHVASLPTSLRVMNDGPSTVSVLVAEVEAALAVISFSGFVIFRIIVRLPFLVALRDR